LQQAWNFQFSRPVRRVFKQELNVASRALLRKRLFAPQYLSLTPYSCGDCQNNLITRTPNFVRPFFFEVRKSQASNSKQQAPIGQQQPLQASDVRKRQQRGEVSESKMLCVNRQHLISHNVDHCSLNRKMVSGDTAHAWYVILYRSVRKELSKRKNENKQQRLAELKLLRMLATYFLENKSVA